jgi:hypothetical protein
MARNTRPPEQDRHIIFIQGQLYSQALLFRPSVLRALPIRQASCDPTSDKCAQRIESAQFGPFGHLWPDATSVSWQSVVFRYRLGLCGLSQHPEIDVRHQSLGGASYFVTDSDYAGCLNTQKLTSGISLLAERRISLLTRIMRVVSTPRN